MTLTINVKIPAGFEPERKYIVGQLLEYLGVSPDFEVWQKPWYELSINDRRLVVRDGFWSGLKETYLKPELLPQKPVFVDTARFTGHDTVSLYGQPKLRLDKDDVILEADIFASAFFMLTRWEEYVIKQRDRLGRFPEDENFLKKHGLHRRPLVCEYVYFLRNVFNYMGVRLPRNMQYQLMITHDVDFLRRFTGFVPFLKGAANDVLRRKSLRLALSTIKKYALFKTGKAPDPYDTFDFLMDVSESVGLKSHFYFIPSLKNEPKAFYDYDSPWAKQAVSRILQRGHTVGIHGSFRGFNNPEIFAMELRRFKQAYGIKPTEGRQHFLRFENPVTWQLWEQNGLKNDSTIGFSTDVGFRAGTCYPYKVFDILQRRRLELMEMPLIFMENAGFKQANGDEARVFDIIISLKDQVKRYDGHFVFLWHNNSFNFGQYDRIEDFYKQSVKYLAQ